MPQLGTGMWVAVAQPPLLYPTHTHKWNTQAGAMLPIPAWCLSRCRDGPLHERGGTPPSPSCRLYTRGGLHPCTISEAARQVAFGFALPCLCVQMGNVGWHAKGTVPPFPLWSFASAHSNRTACVGPPLSYDAALILA